MKQQDKPAIYIPGILKHQVKQELNKQIEGILKAQPEVKAYVKKLSKKARYRFFKEQREKLLKGKTVQQVLEESKEGLI